MNALDDSTFFEQNPLNINVAVFTDYIKHNSPTNKKLSDWNEACRQKGIQTIVTDQNGVFSRVVTDFGPKHVVIDKNGEDIAEVMIYAIEPIVVKKQVDDQETQVQALKIKILPDTNHDFEDRDQVILSEVIGMKKKG